MSELKEIGGFIVSADPFVQHDNTLSGNGTVNSPLSVVPGYNETLLWSAASLPDSGQNGLTLTLNEPIGNFSRILINYDKGTTVFKSYETIYSPVEMNETQFYIGPWCENNTTSNWFFMRSKISGTSGVISAGFTGQAGWKSMTTWNTNMWSQGNIHSIYGVNRISGNQS